MKISPTAIRQKTFETAFRGYEKKEVAAFLEEMSVVMEQINQENLDLRSKLQQVESEAKRLKDVEDSLFRTLKTAEDTGANIITEASEAADQIISEANSLAEQATKEANQYSSQVRNHADEQARIITSAAELKAKNTIKEIRESMQSLVRSYEGLLEQRDAMVKSLRRLSQDALNQIDLSDAHFARIDGKAYTRAVEELSRSSHYTLANIETLSSQVEAAAPSQPKVDMTNATLEPEKQDSIDALESELDDPDTPEVDKRAEELREEEPVRAEVPIEAEMETETEEELEIEEEIPAVEEPKREVEQPRNETPKNSSGSFFDQFD
jgi:cell division initiation protein